MTVDRTRVYFILDEDDRVIGNIHIDYEIDVGDVTIVVTLVNGYHAYRVTHDKKLSENCSFGNASKIAARLLLQCFAAGEIDDCDTRIVDAASDVICGRSPDIIDRLEKSGFKIFYVGSYKSATV